MEDINKKGVELLDIIEKTPNISQRQMSKASGLSVGMVNILIHKLIKTGMIKVEQLNKRTMKYILTPKGINEKTKKTLNYIKNSYKFILDISLKFNCFIEKDIKENKKIFILGEEDELMSILLEVLKRKNADYVITKDPKEVSKENKEYNIYLWDVELENKLEAYNYINILKVKNERPPQSH